MEDFIKYSGRYAPEVRQILASIHGHVTSDRPSRTFDFRTPGKGSSYAFALTWAPGTLSIAGDIGELTLTHYQALRTLRAGLEWAADAHLDYLVSKAHSAPENQYDPDATAREIVHMANEGAGEFFRSLRAERPKARQFHSPEDYAEAKADWADQRAAYFAMRVQERRWPDRGSYLVSPDGWETWYAIWREVGADAGVVDDASILTAAGRSELKESLRRAVDTPGDAYDLCHRIGLEDYYGEFRRPPRVIAQITAIRWAAAKALNWLDGEEAYRWRDPESGFKPPTRAPLLRVAP